MKGFAERLLSASGRSWILVILFLISCGKNESVDLNPSLNVANDIVISQRMMLNAFRMLVRAVHDPELQQTHQNYFDGASVSFDPSVNKYTFLYMGTRCPDSVLRTGSMTAILSGPFGEPGTVIRFGFANFSEDTWQVSATDSLVNTGVSGNVLSFSNTFRDAVIVKDTVGAIRFDADLVWQVPEPVSPENPAAVMSVTGTITGISSRGYPLSANISAQLSVAVFPETCPWTREGTLTFPSADLPGGAGLIRFPGLNSCNDSVYYDLGHTTYRWRMKSNYLWH